MKTKRWLIIMSFCMLATVTASADTISIKAQLGSRPNMQISCDDGSEVINNLRRFFSINTSEGGVIDTRASYFRNGIDSVSNRVTESGAVELSIRFAKKNGSSKFTIMKNNFCSIAEY